MRRTRSRAAIKIAAISSFSHERTRAIKKGHPSARARLCGAAGRVSPQENATEKRQNTGKRNGASTRKSANAIQRGIDILRASGDPDQASYEKFGSAEMGEIIDVRAINECRRRITGRKVSRKLKHKSRPKKAH